MQTRRSRRAHPFTLFVIAFLAAPTVAMLPAIALEGNAKHATPSSGLVPIPMEHVDVVARPKPKVKHLVVRRHRAAPKAKRARSTPALRIGFSWPVTKAPITSPFGWRPFVITPGETGPHPAREFHHGMDIACALNQPVTASKGGRVILSGVNPDYGNVIVIQHAGGWSTLYGHLNKRLVNAGKRVSPGALIGLCGATGRANGVHLHFEIRHLGSFYNPINFLP